MWFHFSLVANPSHQADSYLMYLDTSVCKITSWQKFMCSKQVSRTPATPAAQIVESFTCSSSVRSCDIHLRHSSPGISSSLPPLQLHDWDFLLSLVQLPQPLPVPTFHVLHEDKKTSPIGLGFGSVRHSTTTHTALLLRRFDCFHSFLTAPRRSDSVWLGPVPVNDLAAPGRAPTDCCIDSPHRNCRRLAGLGTAEAALEGSAKHGGDGRLDSRKHFF